MKNNRNSFLIITLIATSIIMVYSAYTMNANMRDRIDQRNQGGEPKGGKEISAADAKRLVNDYRTAHVNAPSPYQTTGFFISRAALDKMLSDDKMNGITIDLADDKGQLTAVMKARSIENPEIITIDESTNIFITQSFCPTDCSMW